MPSRLEADFEGSACAVGEQLSLTLAGALSGQGKVPWECDRGRGLQVRGVGLAVGKQLAQNLVDAQGEHIPAWGTWETLSVGTGSVGGCCVGEQAAQNLGVSWSGEVWGLRGTCFPASYLLHACAYTCPTHLVHTPDPHTAGAGGEERAAHRRYREAGYEGGHTCFIPALAQHPRGEVHGQDDPHGSRQRAGLAWG